MDFVWFILIGIAAGWLAGQIIKGGGYGLLIDLLLGIIGAMIGGWLMNLLNISFGGLIGRLITATIGAVIFIAAVRIIRMRV